MGCCRRGFKGRHIYFCACVRKAKRMHASVEFAPERPEYLLRDEADIALAHRALSSQRGSSRRVPELWYSAAPTLHLRLWHICDMRPVERQSENGAKADSNCARSGPLMTQSGRGTFWRRRRQLRV